MGVQSISRDEGAPGLVMCSHQMHSLSHCALTKTDWKRLVAALGRLHHWTRDAVSAAIYRVGFKLSLFLKDTSRLDKQHGVLMVG